MLEIKDTRALKVLTDDEDKPVKGLSGCQDTIAVALYRYDGFIAWEEISKKEFRGFLDRKKKNLDLLGPNNISLFELAGIKQLVAKISQYYQTLR